MFRERITRVPIAIKVVPDTNKGQMSMEEKLQVWVQDYLRTQKGYDANPHHRPVGEWNDAVSCQFQNKSPHDFAEIYDAVKVLAHDFRGIGTERIWRTAVETAERFNVPCLETLEFMTAKRKYVRYLVANDYLRCITLQDWDLIHFLLFISYRMQTYLRAERIKN